MHSTDRDVGQSAAGILLQALRPQCEFSRLRPAAQYLRMSTDHQRYSLQNQAAAIAHFAEVENYTIVETYVDQGVSGLNLSKRHGLQALLAAALGGAANFTDILIYDVSRWGRFQNPDEAAHYEFLCAQAGLRVVYCAESFSNDTSLASTLFKAVKRAMAAEFSRELSSQTRNAQHRLTQQGWWMAGPPGFGYRRQLIDASGHELGVLHWGERKSAQAHRTRLTLGPAAEVEVVRRIFHQFVQENMTEVQIARRLNAEGVGAENGAPWTFSRVHSILHNPKYIGDLRFNQSQGRLGGRRSRNPPAAWKLARNTHAPLVTLELFEAAQARLQARTVRRTREELCAELTRRLHEHGYLSEAIMTRRYAERGFSHGAYRARFGSLRAAYRAIGYEPRPHRAHCPPIADEELLRRLAELLKAKGYLSGKLISKTAHLPVSEVVAQRLGGLKRVYALLGYTGHRAERQRQNLIAEGEGVAARTGDSDQAPPPAAP